MSQPAKRDIRGSLEVFNPSTYQTVAPFRSQPTWWSKAEPPQNNPEPPPATDGNVALSASHSGRVPAEEIKSWMALKDPNPYEAPPVMMPSQPPSSSKNSTVPCFCTVTWVNILEWSKVVNEAKSVEQAKSNFSATGVSVGINEMEPFLANFVLDRKGINGSCIYCINVL